MAITAEMAKAELERRRSSKPSITPDMARAELIRRKALSKEERKEAQEPDEENSIIRSIAKGTRNAIAGTADTLDLLASPVRAGINVFSKPFGYNIPTLGEETAKGIDTLSGGMTTPRNASERTQEAIQRTIGGMPIGAGIGMAGKALRYAPKALKATSEFLRGTNAINPANVASAGATAGLIQSHLNQNPEDIAGAAGKGFLVPALTTAAELATKKGRLSKAGKLGEFLQINPEAIETFQKAGITPTLPDVSKGKIPKLVSSKLEHTPFASSPIVNAKNLQKTQILEGLGQGEIGQRLSKLEASNIVHKGAKSFQKEKEKEFSTIFDKVESDISKIPDDSIGTKNVDKYFESIFKKFKTSSQEKKFRQSPLGKMYIDLYETAKQHKGKLPYQDMKDRLDEVNDLITTHGEIGRVSQGKMKQFAKTISKDIEESLEPQFKSMGHESYKNWKDAKKLYGEYAQNEIPKLNELYKKDKKGATDAFIDLVTNQKKGAEKAKIVLKGLSHKDQIDLTDAIHKELGRTTDGTFSPLKWVRGYKNLEPDAQKILLSPLNKATQEKFGHIADTIDHLKSTLAEANTSKTAYHTALVGLAAAGTKATTSLMSGNPLPIASLAGGLLLGNKISDKVLTNPKFINWMYKGIKAKNLNQFEKNLQNVPHVGKYRKTLAREIQSFQRDLKEAKGDK